MHRPLQIRWLALMVTVVVALAVAGCGGDDASSAPTDGKAAADSGSQESDDVAPTADDVPLAPDLEPQAVCDAIPVAELVAVMDGELGTVEALDGPPQCSVGYGTSDEARARGAANGTNLLVFVPTSDDREGKTGAAGIEIASQYAFYDTEPEPVDVGDGGLTNGTFLYYSVGGRIVGIGAGDDMTAGQLIEVAELTVGPLTP